MSENHTPNKLFGKATGQPHLRFDGKLAGVGTSKSGNTNSPFCYSIICGCGAFIGVLGIFRRNDSGQRTPYCPICKHIIVLDKDDKVVAYQPYDISKQPPQRSSP